MRRLAMVLGLVAGSCYGNIAFDLVNKSGHDFSRIWLARHGTGSWKLVSKEVLKTGNGVEVRMINDWQSWDLRVQYSKKDYEIWGDFDLSIYRITIEILPNGKWNAHYEFKTS